MAIRPSSPLRRSIPRSTKFSSTSWDLATVLATRGSVAKAVRGPGGGKRRRGREWEGVTVDDGDPVRDGEEDAEGEEEQAGPPKRPRLLQGLLTSVPR